MTAEILKYRTYRKVAYYTIMVNGRPTYEFNDFITRMNNVATYKPELGKILQFIEDIGNKHGALESFFRAERLAQALPPKFYHYIAINDDGQHEYGLRLYCIRLTSEVVILLNGDMKTTFKADDCPNCSKHFKFANRIADKINREIEAGGISIYGKEIEMDDDFELDI